MDPPLDDWQVAYPLPSTIHSRYYPLMFSRLVELHDENKRIDEGVWLRGQAGRLNVRCCTQFLGNSILCDLIIPFSWFSMENLVISNHSYSVRCSITCMHFWEIFFLLEFQAIFWSTVRSSSVFGRKFMYFWSIFRSSSIFWAKFAHVDEIHVFVIVRRSKK